MPIVSSGGGGSATLGGSGKKKKKGGGLFDFLPDIGLVKAAKIIPDAAMGVIRLGTGLLPGGAPAGAAPAALGKGLVRSIEGLGYTAAEIATLGKAPKPTSSVVGGAPARSFFEQTGQEGLLPALFETIGTASLLGGAAGKLAKAGKVGKVADAAVTAERAAKAARAGAGTSRAATVARQAEKAAGKAAGLSVDAGAAARRAAVLRGTRAVANPYRTTFEGAIRPVTRAAQAKAAGIPGAVADAAVAAPVPTPRSATILGVNAGPAETAFRSVNDALPPDWATRLVNSRVGGAVTRPAAALENRILASGIKRGVYNERVRLQSGSRRATKNSAFADSARVAMKELRGKTLADGTRITSRLADEMVGTYLTSKATLGPLAEGAAGAALAGTPFIPNPIPSQLMTPKLAAALGEATTQLRALDVERTAAIRSSRLGTKGLDDGRTAIPTKGQARELRAAARQVRDAAAIRAERVPAARIAAEKRLGRLDAQIVNLRNQMKKIEAQEASIGGRTTPVSNVRRSSYIQRTLARAERKQAALRELSTLRADIERALIEGTLPAERRAAALDAKADRTFGRIEAAMDSPSITNTPAIFKPLMGAVDHILKAAEKDPGLAAVAAELPQGLAAVMRYAAERGFDPIHVSSLSAGEVHRMVYGAIALGRRGQSLARETEGPFRKARGSAAARTQSVEALIAGHLQVAHELNTNAVVTALESITHALPESGIVPAGFEPFSPVRRFIMTGERTADGLAVPPPGVERIIPSAVVRSLDRMGRDFSNPISSAIQAVTNPWRLLVLTLSPTWYANNFLGNMVMATKEGVRPQDWAKAWREYRNNFKDTPAVTGQAQFSSEGFASLIGDEGIRQSAKTGKLDGGTKGAIKAAAGATAHRLQRVNEVVDELSRAAVFESNIRRGASVESALNRAITALIDYNDMTPFERQVVRSVVPFYSFQKGILKLVAKMPLDHPQAMAAVSQFAAIQREALAELGLPEGYAGIVSGVNLKGLNPFQDAADAFTLRGIAKSMNPFAEVVLRSTLGAPEGGFADSFRINDFGGTEPDVSIGQGLLDIVTNLPQGRLLRGTTGDAPEGSSGLRELGKFLGVKTYSDAELERIRDRLKKSQKRTGQPTGGIGLIL